MTAYPDMFSLAGRTAVVTGAGSGLGAVIAEAMVEAGAGVRRLAGQFCLQFIP